MLMTFLSVACLLSGLAHLWAEYIGPKKGAYLFKPLTMVLIIGVLFSKPMTDPLYGWLVVLGLVCSLVGDVFLMLDQKHFVKGLASFLVAHLFYIAAFHKHLTFNFGAIAVLLVYGGCIYGYLYKGLGKYAKPVLLYLLVIITMVHSAYERWLTEDTFANWTLLKGAVLFALSDSILAFKRFGKPFKSAQFLVMTTYYAAQWLIAVSVGL